MKGNNFLPIDLGKRQKQILNPDKNNRRVIHYSYNLVNNIGTEEDMVKKDGISAQQNATNSLVKTYATTASIQYDVYGRQALAKRQGVAERKFSLPSTRNAKNMQNGLQGNESKKLIDSSASPLSRERRKTSHSSQVAAANRHQKSEQRDLEKYNSYRSDRPTRYSDPLYEQRSLPPIPYRSPYHSETSATNGVWSPDILDSPILPQFSNSQNSLVPSTGTHVARKEGLSAAENKDIMQGKLRKKAVCDSTDDSHYQRQFLRVLNKRF